MTFHVIHIFDAYRQAMKRSDRLACLGEMLIKGSSCTQSFFGEESNQAIGLQVLVST
jgi:hypothetical protein